MKTASLFLSFLLTATAAQAATWGDIFFAADTLASVEATSSASTYDPARGLVNAPFLMARCEVQTWQWAAFLNATRATDPAKAARYWHKEMDTTAVVNPGMAPGIAFSEAEGYTVQEGCSRRPITLVSREAVEAFLDFLSTDAETGIQGSRTFRLPSEDEWYAAAFFDPTQSLWLESLAGTSGEHFMTTGTLPALQIVGNAPNARGISDMGGNAAEWVAAQDGETQIVLGGSANALSTTQTAATSRGGLHTTGAFASYVGLRTARAPYAGDVPAAMAGIFTDPATPVDGDEITIHAPFSGATQYYWYVNDVLVSITTTNSLVYSGFTFADIGASVRVVAIGGAGSNGLNWAVTQVDPNLSGNRLTWLGGGSWEIEGTTQWSSSEGPVLFTQGARVTFPAGMGEITVPIVSEGITPGDVIVDTAPGDTTTFSGTGTLAGTFLLIKRGEGTFTIANSNPEADCDVQVKDGVLRLESDVPFGTTTRNLTPAAISVAEGAQVILAMPAADESAAVHTYRVQGEGPDGLGALRSDTALGLGFSPAVGNFILEGDTTLGAWKPEGATGANAGNWQLGRVTTTDNPGITGGGHTLTMKGNARVISNGPVTDLAEIIVESGEFRSVAASEFDVGALTLNGGTFSIDASQSTIAAPLTLNGGNFANDTTLTLTQPITITADSTVSPGGPLRPAGGILLPQDLILAKRGAGQLQITGENPGLLGTIQVEAGSIALTNALPAEARIALNGGTLTCTGESGFDLQSPITGSNSMTLGGTSATFRLRSVAIDGSAIFSIGDTTLNSPTLNVEEGDSIRVPNLYMGRREDNAAICTINQNGGTIELTGAASTQDGNYRVGHWGSSVTYHNLNGGELKLTNPNGRIDLSVSGNGTLTVNGGILRTPQIEMNGRTTKDGTGVLLLNGGQTFIGSAGITHTDATTTDQTLFRAGTLTAADTTLPIKSIVTFDGDGSFALNAPADATITLTKAMQGTGGFTKTGEGTLALTGGGAVEGTITLAEGTLLFTRTDDAITAIGAGNITSTGGTITVTGMEDADPSSSYTLITLSDGSSTKPPPVKNTADCWRTIRIGNEIQLRYFNGTIITLY